MMGAQNFGSDGSSLGDRLRKDVEEYNACVDRKFQPGIDLYNTLIELKNNNGAYRGVVEKLICDSYSAFPDNGLFSEGYSAEYELGYRRGLSIFLFPEGELQRYEERREQGKREEL
jgi:hypothetical protein